MPGLVPCQRLAVGDLSLRAPWLRRKRRDQGEAISLLRSLISLNGRLLRRGARSAIPRNDIYIDKIQYAI
jgi:hypothetical protein